MTLVGGTSIDSDKRALNRPSGVDIIVATPGRLLQHLEETKGMVNMCKASKVLIFDEADRLLDMGFKRDIDKIVNYLKPVTTSRDAENPMNKFTRQTLLFSATFSNEIKEIASQALRKGYEVIDTVGEEEEQTHAHIPQSMIVASLDNQMEVLSKLIAQQMTMPQYKVIVFFPTARQTGFFAELFNAADASTITSVAGKAVDHLPILEIHSRKSQAQRTRASDQFRSSANAILFSSDVTARGMDYPDVTLVIQIGEYEYTSHSSECILIIYSPIDTILYFISHDCDRNDLEGPVHPPHRPNRSSREGRRRRHRVLPRRRIIVASRVARPAACR